MVEERIDDGRRIAQLLASEITGRERDALAALSVDDANPDAEPTDDGTFAYDVDCDGDRLATVRMFPNQVAVAFVAGATTPDGVADDVEKRPGLRRESAQDGDADLVVVVEYGAAVKAAVDVLTAVAAARDC